MRGENEEGKGIRLCLRCNIYFMMYTVGFPGE